VESSPVPRSSGRRGKRREWPWIALTISIAVHVVLVLMSSVEGRQPVLPHRPAHIVVLPPLADPSRPVEMPYRAAPAQPTVPGREPARHPRRLPERPPVTVPPPPPVAHPRADSDLVALPAPVTPDRIGPSWADGFLWVRPLPLPARELAQRLKKTDAELADSVVKATIQAFLDSIAREPDAGKAALPEWSAQIAGKKFGIDQKYLTVAGLKIPAAVLALIPLHGGYNESKVFDRTDELLADLRYAANRAQTVDEFKHAISEMRRRKQEEHEFQRNQRSEPPPELRSPPPVPVVTQATPDTVPERPQ